MIPYYIYNPSCCFQFIYKKMVVFAVHNCLLFSFFFHWILLLSLLLDFSLLVASHSSIVKFLPGFDGPLPFELETGYVGVDEWEDVQLFYYFAKSGSNPREDPLVLWLTGGPGCSSFTAFAYEVGPLNFKAVQDDGSLPKLVLNPNSWTKGASIIFVDLPVGTGFSYARTSAAAHSIDLQACGQAYEFMRKWLIDHPEFLSNPFYIAGESYSGITVPTLAHLISEGNEVGIKPFINLKGYVLGNPLTFVHGDGNYAIPFAHGMGLISDELYESLQRNCEGEYMNVDPSNDVCWNDVQAYSQCISGLQHNQILEPQCGFASPKPHELFGKRRSLYDENPELLHPDQSPCAGNRVIGYRLSYSWLDNDSVREALHIEKGSIGQWIRCNYGLSYTSTITDSYQYHVKLSAKGYRSLIFSGDHDMLVPFLGTQAWIKSLNYSIVDDWRSWIVEGQVAGYTRSYSNGMTFATVKAWKITPLFLLENIYDCFPLFQVPFSCFVWLISFQKREADTQLQSTSLLNVQLCSKGGYHINLCEMRKCASKLNLENRPNPSFRGPKTSGEMEIIGSLIPNFRNE